MGSDLRGQNENYENNVLVERPKCMSVRYMVWLEDQKSIPTKTI